MTTMNVSDFEALGLNTNEAKVYLALIKYGRCDASTITTETKFHKNIVYDNLNKLIDRGLVSFIHQDHKRIFKLAEPHALSNHIQEQLEDVEKNLQKAKKLEQEIREHTSQQPTDEDAAVYRGVRAIKSFLKSMLGRGELLVFGAPEESVSIMGEAFWKNYTRKREDAGDSARMIFNASTKGFAESIDSDNTEIRYFEAEFEPLTQTQIQADCVAIIVWKQEPVLFVIEDVSVARNYAQYFERMWSQAQ